LPLHVERRDEAFILSGTRVSLDSIVYGFLSGQSAESIAQSFPVLTLEQVYGAIAYHLGHRDEIDGYLATYRPRRRRRRSGRHGNPRHGQGRYAYVPLDPAYPRQRLVSILKQCDIRALVTENMLFDRAVDLAGRSRPALPRTNTRTFRLPHWRKHGNTHFTKQGRRTR
jgi:uncharacterized protein (DUF433 family)